jgi:hypothetical protein
MKIGTLELKGRSAILVVMTPFSADEKLGARTKETKGVAVDGDRRSESWYRSLELLDPDKTDWR